MADMTTFSPLWLSAAQLPPDLSAAARDWLFNEDSLTRRLTRLSRQRFSVRPLLEEWQALRADECQALGIADGSEGWVREVYLCGRDTPWVFARSVVDRVALERSGFDLERLGSRSLGELLFSDQAFARGALSACRYPAAWLPTDVRCEGLWGRRSCFSRDRLRVLVGEVFLPAFWDDPEQAGH